MDYHYPRPPSPGFRPTYSNIKAQKETGKTAGQRYANAKAATAKAATAKAATAKAATSLAVTSTNKYVNALEESLKRVRNMKASYTAHAPQAARARLPHLTMAAAKAAANAAVKAATNAAVKAVVHKPMMQYRTHMSGANITRRISPKVEKATEKAVETIMDKFVKKIEATHKRARGGMMTLRNRNKLNRTRKLY